MASRSKIDEMLEEHPTLIISKNNCKACEQAIKFLKEMGIDYHETKIDSMNLKDQESVTDDLRKRFSHLTFPIIFMNKKYVGGCRELKETFSK